MAAVLLTTLWLLAACGVDGDHFRIKGKFTNINQGEFYVYSPDRGLYGIDTLKLVDGRFNYEVPLQQEATFVIVFPNYSELAVFGEPGLSVEVKGDATHLKETIVKGGDANKRMTAFRNQVLDKPDKEVQKKVKETITADPASVINQYLINHYLICCKEPDYKMAADLAALMSKEQPANKSLSAFAARLKGIAAQSGKMPAFKAKATNGTRVSQASLTSEVNVVSLWASWDYESVNMQKMLKRLKKDNPGKLSLVSINIDASKKAFDNNMKRDSLNWPQVWEPKMWDGEAVKALGFSIMSDNILADAKGKVVARGLSKRELEDKINEMLGKETTTPNNMMRSFGKERRSGIGKRPSGYQISDKAKEQMKQKAMEKAEKQRKELEERKKLKEQKK